MFVESRFDSLLQKIVTLLALTFKFKFDYYLNHVKVPRVPLRYQKLSRSGSKLFDPHWDNEKSGMNPPQTHLAQITGLLGNFASEFLDRGTKSKRYFDDQGQPVPISDPSCSVISIRFSTTRRGAVFNQT